MCFRGENISNTPELRVSSAPSCQYVLSEFSSGVYASEARVHINMCEVLTKWSHATTQHCKMDLVMD